jgi:transposase
MRHRGRERRVGRRTALISQLRAVLLDRRIAACDAEFLALAREDDAVRRLAEVPGLGPLTASALVAAVGDAQQFKRARDLGAWPGLAPRQATTSGGPRRLGLSRWGGGYLHKMLIHGARAALPGWAARETATGRWRRGRLERAHKSRALAALAHQLSRIGWAVLARGEAFGVDHRAMHG